jgi:hypothetical protein
VEQDVIEWLTPLQGSLNENPQAFLDLILTDVLVQTSGPDFGT